MKNPLARMWKATHRIVFRPSSGAPDEIWLVMFVQHEPWGRGNHWTGYTEAEWAAQTPPTWSHNTDQLLGVPATLWKGLHTPRCEPGEVIMERV